MLILISIAPLYAKQQAQGRTSADVVQSNQINLRMGISTATSNGQPTICVEGALFSDLSIESCGTGYGFVHQEPGTDFVHFRGKWSLYTQQFAQGLLSAQIGGGFAELQLAADELGFHFRGTGAGIETAGPEISTSIQWLRASSKKSELLIDMNIGSAFFHHGPSLVEPQNRLYPFCELSVGVGW